MILDHCHRASCVQIIDQLRTTITEKDARIAQLESMDAVYAKRNDALKERIAELEDIREMVNAESESDIGFESFKTVCTENEILRKRITQLEEALEKLLSVTRHLEPCAGTVDEVEVVLDKLRNQK